MIANTSGFYTIQKINFGYSASLVQLELDMDLLVVVYGLNPFPRMDNLYPSYFSLHGKRFKNGPFYLYRDIVSIP